ncbi:JAB domain-containing protein [Thermicanus aegyptius]|uniref:JAB domain-containing protein n=1 Tax=Thermicanus aegyptius TaxID=94009 RepID=UPI000428D00E|nr:JAB domain-containing protein [Thermicanus aegyptius]
MSTRINIFSVRLIREASGLYDVEKVIDNPVSAEGLIRKVLHLHESPVEKFGFLSLNVRNKVTGVHVVSVGAINYTLIDPRSVFVSALLNNATGIILFHNHPSGDPSPSKEDVELTKRIVKGGEILNINVLDHIIVGEIGFTSLKELGHM